MTSIIFKYFTNNVLIIWLKFLNETVIQETVIQNWCLFPKTNTRQYALSFTAPTISNKTPEIPKKSITLILLNVTWKNITKRT